MNVLFSNTLSLNSSSFGEFNGSNFYKNGLVIHKISCFKVAELILIFWKKNLFEFGTLNLKHDISWPTGPNFTKIQPLFH